MEDYLRTLVERGKDNMTLLLYLQKDYCVSWSLSTLKRRLKDWNIKRHGEYTPDNVRRAVQKELQTARKLVGIKRMYQRLRQHHHMLVKRDQVEAIMVEQNYSAMLKRRCGRLQIGERRRFFSKGPNWSWHLDGYDKLLGYKRNKFPFAVHGCIDSFSRKILWMRVHLSNKSPNRIALYFWETVIAENVYPRRTRSDAGTEVGLLAQCQMFLHRNTDVKDVHVYGSSITNQCIESWWAQLRKYNAQYWIDEFK
ncbi:uncharacterized protein LOC100370556, partial [Saccoglossus kowalevskii]|uniref:Uncharacterized protein LOC100370556 n=1 Tax=Saccoglossus kowalevskii TaxID=10224 RepID=A0ABM0GQH3_SACKO